MSKTKDPFEEFEFKPLTDGLGFHAKAVNLKDEVAKSGLTAPPEEHQIPDFSDLMDDLDSSKESPLRSSAALTSLPDSPLESEYVKSFDDGATEIHRPLLRNDVRDDLRDGAIDGKKPKNRSEKDSDALNRIDTKLELDFKDNELKTPSLDKEILQQTEVVEQFRKVPTAIFAAIFDAVVAFTVSIVFMVAMMSVIKVDLLGLLLNSETQIITQLSFVGMYLAILQLYTVISRSIARCTLGEWAFDIHLAQRSGETTAIFPILVIWRSVLNMATGFVLLPLISLIVRRDVASYFTGTQLFQLK